MVEDCKNCGTQQGDGVPHECENLIPVMSFQESKRLTQEEIGQRNLSVVLGMRRLMKKANHLAKASLDMREFLSPENARWIKRMAISTEEEILKLQILLDRKEP